MRPAKKRFKFSFKKIPKISLLLTTLGLSIVVFVISCYSRGFSSFSDIINDFSDNSDKKYLKNVPQNAGPFIPPPARLPAQSTEKKKDTTPLKAEDSENYSCASDANISCTDKLKTYRNENIGFELTYADGYSLEENRSSVFKGFSRSPEEDKRIEAYYNPIRQLVNLSIYSPEKKYAEINVDIYGAGGMNLNEWIDYVNKGVEQGLINEGRDIRGTKEINLFGYPAVKGRSGCCMSCISNFLLLNNGKVFDISLLGSIEDCGKGDKTMCCIFENKTEAEFNRLFESFKFID